MSSSLFVGNLGQLLCEAPFRTMYAEFMQWRIDPFIRQQEASRAKGRILPFVRGLRLSAHLIYAIRQILTGTGLTANWGHLVDQSRTLCSCECDVIIHREGQIARWNGTDNQIMDFRFVEQQKAVLVISCKSYLTSSHIDSEYYNSIKPFVDKLWLFAECCGPRSVDSICNKALKLGYEKFWPLYTWSRQRCPEPNRAGWNDFVRKVEKLKQ